MPNNLLHIISILVAMFASNFLTSPASKATTAAFQAGRAAICNPDRTGKCRGDSQESIFNIFPTSTTVTSSSSAATFGFLFIIALLTFIIFLVLLFIHYTLFPVFALSVNDPGLVLIPTSIDRELSYKKDGIAVPTLARNRDTGITGNKTMLPHCNYTIGVDMFINGGLNPINYPNVVLYRGLEPVSRTSAESATKENLNTKYVNTNILVWLEKDTNNLNVTLVIIDASLTQRLQHVPSIENVPLNKKFRLVVVLADSFIEVYINGGLQQSMQITGNLKPIGTATGGSGIANDFYPPINTFDQGGVKISNMSMWPRVITSKEIRTYEATPMSS